MSHEKEMSAYLGIRLGEKLDNDFEAQRRRLGFNRSDFARRLLALGLKQYSRVKLPDRGEQREAS